MDTHKWVHLVLLFVLGLWGAGCTQPQSLVIYGPTHLAVDGEYVHPYCGMTFPETIDGFTRLNIINYSGPLEDNISATYNCTAEQVPMFVTVYVYPSPIIGSDRKDQPGFFDAYFHHLLADVAAQHEDTVLLAEDEYVLRQPNRSLTGRHAVLNYKETRDAFQEDVVSELYLFEHDRWLIKYRISYPWAVQGQAGVRIADFLEALTIPDKKG